MALLVPPYHLLLILFSPLLYTFDLLCKFHRRLRAGVEWPLKDKVVLITGASSGIGEALALQYAKAGACVVLCARRDDELKRVEEECKKAGAKRVLSVKTNVADEAQVGLSVLERSAGL